MAYIFDTSLYATGTANPLTMSYTCGVGTSVFVLGIAVSGAAMRYPAGGVAAIPTFGGKQLLIIDGSSQNVGGECVAEMWYLLSPSTGSAYTVSVPNTSKTLYIRGTSYKAGGGDSSTYTSSFDISIGNTATTANPSTGIATSRSDDLLVQMFTSGLATIPTSGYFPLNWPILRVDHGAFGSTMLWYPATDVCTYRMGVRSATSDDYGLVTASFKEIYVPNRIKSISGIADASVVRFAGLKYDTSVQAINKIGN
jgi:hypothetical protein